ncbi:MAG: cation:proton antiporter [Magnetospiraceae bacterium]
MNVASFVHITAILLALAAAFGYVNHRWLHMPHTIGLVVVALFASIGVMGIDAVAPQLHLGETVRHGLAEIDFRAALMEGMLAFLLFAGALHVDLADLFERRFMIGGMATAGVLISTFLVGFGFYGITGLMGVEVPLIYCLVFGALISPTDPVAVLGVLKTVKVPKSLEAKIAGESLFNDGVGVVVFAVIVAIATGGGHHGGEMGVGDVALFFVQEAIGGAVLGFVGGYIVYRAMKSINEHTLEVVMTLALVFGLTAIAHSLHVSGPIAVVVAGLLIGNHGTRFAMSESTKHHVQTFWTLLDEILNSVLFLIIGLEIIAFQYGWNVTGIALACIPLVLLARFISVSIPVGLIGFKRDLTKGAIPVLTWGGLRGGISVALALSLPDGPYKELILAVTYAVVIFSIVVQGLTVGAVVKKTVRV